MSEEYEVGNPSCATGYGLWFRKHRIPTFSPFAFTQLRSTRNLLPMGSLFRQNEPGEVAVGALSRSHAVPGCCNAFGDGSRETACGVRGPRFSDGHANQLQPLVEAREAMEDRGLYGEGRYAGCGNSFPSGSLLSRCDGRKRGLTTWR
jgi:hypothetical protein